MPQEQFTSDDFYTPPWIFDRMGIGFDVDVAAPPGGVPWVPARDYFDQEADGLAQSWRGRVWMNPPFSNTAQWARRFAEHRNGVALLQVAKAAYTVDLWAAADGIAMVPEKIRFVVSHDFTRGDDRYRQVFMPCWLVAFGVECVDAIARVGAVRRLDA